MHEVQEGLKEQLLLDCLSTALALLATTGITTTSEVADKLDKEGIIGLQNHLNGIVAMLEGNLQN